MSLLHVAARQQTSALHFSHLMWFAVVACASAQTERAVPSVQTIVNRMVRAQDENRVRYRPYMVTREYKLSAKTAEKPKSQVIADVTFVPPDVTLYTIQQTTGSGLGERVVRRMLETEAEVVRDYASTGIMPDNYDFRFVRREELNGHQCYVLQLLPKRKDKNLIHGNAWVDANSYLIHRIEGEPAKIPSFWLRDVHVALVYGDVEGMWLSTASKATANVRMFGRYSMDSRDLKYQFRELVAAVSGK